MSGLDKTAFTIVTPEVGRRMSGIEIIESMLAGSLPNPPFMAVTGVRMVSVSVGKARFEGIPSGNFYNPMGIVHGGWTSLLLDTAMGCSAQTTMKAGEICSTIDMTCSFVKPIRESMGPLICEGIVLHRGGRVVATEGKLWDQNGTLLAFGTESCIVSDI